MEELAQLSNASASFEEIADMGGPSNPLEFPEPGVSRGIRVTARVYNPASGEEISVPNVIYQENAHHHNRAYWIGRKLKKSINGCVRSCTILSPRINKDGEYSPDSWEITSQMGAVKIADWNIVRMNQGNNHSEDPIKEVAAMQFAGTYGAHCNIVQGLDVMVDDQYLYIFMPFCTKGELFAFVEREGRFSEPVARFWFRQILSGLYHMQKTGICHRDLSLENLLVNQEFNCVIIDLGMCLRVPFAAEDGSVTDVSSGTLRRLIKPQGKCGKPNYIAPEILQSCDAFDGFGVDVWAAGIILFIMLVGLPPFELAHDEDPRFRMITRGKLNDMLSQWNRTISNDAAELLQNMLRKDPRDRLSLMEVMDHRWVISENVSPPRVVQNQDWRN